MGVGCKIYYKDQTIFEGEWNEAPHHIDSSKILHKEDGPAIEWNNGTKHWFQNGFCHRIDGPAIEWNGGFKEWFLNGKRHRENGPAIMWSHGEREWFLEGRQYTKKEFNNILKEVDSLDPVIGLVDPREWIRNRWKRKMRDAS